MSSSNKIYIFQKKDVKMKFTRMNRIYTCIDTSLENTLTLLPLLHTYILFSICVIFSEIKAVKISLNTGSIH